MLRNGLVPNNKYDIIKTLAIVKIIFMNIDKWFRHEYLQLYKLYDLKDFILTKQEIICPLFCTLPQNICSAACNNMAEVTMSLLVQSITWQVPSALQSCIEKHQNYAQ